MRLLTFVSVTIFVLSCANYERVYLSDIDDLIFKKKIANETLIEEAEKRNIRFGLDDWAITEMKEVHQNYSQFLDSVDFYKGNLVEKVNGFHKRIAFKYLVDFPSEYLINDNTQPAIAKLQIVEIENVTLRSIIASICPKYTTTKLALVPEKNIFNKGEVIKGELFFAGLFAELKGECKINGHQVEQKNGIGSFSLPTESVGEIKLIASMKLGDTTIYASTTVLVKP